MLPILHSIMSNLIKSSEYRKDSSGAHEQTNVSSITTAVKTKSSLLVYTATELLASFDGKETDFLWDNLIPRTGTGLLVGPPDMGKSQLAKELAITIAKGSTEYLGQRLKPIHNRVLYVFTEDQEDAVSSSLNKQLLKHVDLDKNNLSLAFLTDETITELIKKLSLFCEENPVDLIIVDAFGDIFSGSDTNSNIQMRRDIKAFDELVRTHRLALLFVHHVNKAGYKSNPSQELIQGGSGLTQKVRYALYLSRNESGQKFFNVAKGNYTSNFYKENRLPVEFEEETLTFDVMGNWESMNSNVKKSKQELTESDLFMIFKDKGFPFKTTCLKIKTFLNVSLTTAERRLRDLATIERVKNVKGLYYLDEFAPKDSSEINAETKTTFTPNTQEKVEGDGNENIFDTAENPDASTFSPQTIVNFEGEGNKEISQANEGFRRSNGNCENVILKLNERVTFNTQDLLGKEGEGSFDFNPEILVLPESETEYVLDPIIKFIHDRIGSSVYGEDENFYLAAEDFFKTGPGIFRQEEVYYLDLEWILQDNYDIDAKQSRMMMQIFKDLNLFRIDEFGRVHAI